MSRSSLERLRVALAAPLITCSVAAFEPAGTTTSPRMLAALDSVRSESIKSDLQYIAGDELGGRDTPSEGLEKAARFLAARLERLGWKPGAKDGYFFEYPLELRKLDEQASSLVFEAGGEKRAFALGKDYFPPSSFDLVEIGTKGRVVFVGRGTRDEFEKAPSLVDKWVLCFDGGEDPREVGRRAKRAKAAGFLFAPGPDYSGEDYLARFAATLERQRGGQVRWPESKSDAKSKDDKGRAKDGARDGAKDGDRAEKDEKGEGFASLILTRDTLGALLHLAKANDTPAFGSTLSVNVTESRKLVGDHGRILVKDVCGFFPGSDARLSKEVILLTAHYDHLGTQNGVIYNGADDNGSGTCGNLAIAEALTQHGPLKRSVMVIWVSGEEKGLWGSQAWTENPWLPEGCKAVADINIDMIGRNAPDMLLITPTKKLEKSYNAIVQLAEALAPSEGFPVLGSADEYYRRSDHYNFAKLGIPVAFLFSDVHADYHKPTDKPDKIDYDKIRRVARLVLRMLDGMQTGSLEAR